MAYQTSTSMRRYGRGSGTSLRTYAKDCVCDSGREWCCAGRSRGSRSSISIGTLGDDSSVGVQVDDRELAIRDTLSGPTVKTVAGVALTYHGYKRTGSILWALIYGTLGKTVPLVAVPVAIAQGFGKKKEGC